MRHYILYVDKSEGDDNDEFDSVLHLIRSCNTEAIIFCNSNRNVDWLSKNLRYYSLPQTILSLHGGMSNNKQENTIDEFNEYSSILVTSNIMAKNCLCCNLVEAPLVINFDLPRHRDVYKHRGSRACDFINRYGNEKEGIVINFYDEHEDDALEELEQIYNIGLKVCPSYQSLVDMFYLIRH